MKIGIVGSRNIKEYDIDKYIPKEISEIVSGGAVGIDRCARKYATDHNIKLTEFLPEYEKYGRRLLRLKEICR